MSIQKVKPLRDCNLQVYDYPVTSDMLTLARKLATLRATRQQGNTGQGRDDDTE